MKKIMLSGFTNFFGFKDLSFENKGESSFKLDFSKESLTEEGYSHESRGKGISSLILLFVLFLFSNFLTAQVITIDGQTSDWSNNPSVKHVQDAFGNGVVDNQFTEGSKDFLFANQLAWVIGQTKAKNDIANGGFGLANQVKYVDANNITQTLNGSYLVFAGDRTSNNGDAQIGFWFYLNSTAPVEINGDRYFAPPHARGDLLVLADFTGGGRLGTVKVYRWIGGGATSPGSTVVPNTDGNLETTNIASIVAENNAGTPSVPMGWNFVSASYDINEFYEGFVDLGAIGGNNNFTCSATVLLETRSSQSVTASLDDFIGGTLGEVPTVTVNSPSICAGGSATITATPNPAGIYTYAWTVPEGATNPGNVSSFSVTVAGTYSVVVTTEAGCPSSPGSGTLSNFPVTQDNTASGSVCVGDKFTYEGVEYLPGTYNIARTDANGCSWKTVLTVTNFPVTQDNTASGSVCVGDKFTYEGVEYLPGTYNIARTDANGCSWKTVLTVTNFPVTQDNTASGSVCVGDKFTYEGVEYLPGTYNIARTDANGCSWKTVLTVTNFPVTQDNTASGSVCVGDKFTYEGVEYLPGTYNIARTDANGCSWKTVLTVTNFPVTQDNTASGSVCVGDKFTYEGVEYLPGTYNIARTDANGCSWKTVLTVTNFPVTQDNTASGSVCVGDKFTYEGVEYLPGTYNIARTDANGCSWKTVLIVTNFPVTQDNTASGSVCVGDKFTYEGVEYLPGTYNIARTDANGCSWKTVLTVTNFPVTQDNTASGSVCVGDKFTYEGVEYLPGTYNIARTDANGCSWKTVLIVTNFPVTQDNTASGSVCVGDKFTYEGVEYLPGTYNIARTDANGCSWKTVLTVTNFPVTQDNTASGSVCVGDKFTYEGVEYLPGTYNIARTDANGCSWKTVLTVTNFPVTQDNTASGSVCVGDKFTYEGVEYLPGTYNIARTDANGCSWKTVLTVTNFPVTQDNTASGSVCVGDKFTYEGVEYLPGTYNIARTDANGCSWKTVLTVTNFPVTQDNTASGSVCVGDKFTYEGVEYLPGTYNIARTDANGCSWKTVLTVTNFPVTQDNTASGSVCVGDKFTYEGVEYLPGTYNIARTDANGCSWKTVLTVTNFPVTQDNTASGSVCVGDKFTYEGVEYLPGTYNIARTDANGCSWKTVLTVTNFPVTQDNTASGSVCVGDKFTYEGVQYLPGTYNIARTDANGCSWKTVLTVTNFPVTQDNTASGSVCVGDKFTYEGVEYLPGTYNIARTDANGCSWKTVLTVTNFPVTQDNTASGSVCVGDKFTYEGVEYLPGTYNIARTDANGCSWKTVLTVTNFPVTQDNTASGSVCVGDKFTYEGVEYLPGTYNIARTDANGCSWKTVLTVTENPLPVCPTTEYSVSTSVLCGVTKEAAQANTDSEFASWLAGYTYDNVLYTAAVTSYTYDMGVKSDNGDGPQNPIAGKTAKVIVTWTLTDKETGCKNSCSSTFTIENACRVLCSSVDTDVLCTGEKTGSVTITASGGSLPYTIDLFENGNLVAIATQISNTEPSQVVFENLAAGQYSYTISDGNLGTCGNNELIEIGAGTPCGSNCTYTQGAYGTEGGKSCAEGITYSTKGLIAKALSFYPLGTMTIGLPGRSIKIANTTTDIQKIIDVLPGGGSSAVLSVGNDVSIASLPSSYLKKGVINNTLLAQTITLGLNLGIDSDLGSFVLQSGTLAIAIPEGGCGSEVPKVRSCSYDVYTPTINEYKYYNIPSIVNLLPVKTVQGLFDMANVALGGGTLPEGLTLSNLASAVDLINNVFDNCRISMGYNQTPLTCIADRAAFEVNPVPIVDYASVTYQFSYVSNVTIEVRNGLGVLLSTYVDPTPSYLGKVVSLPYLFNVSGNYFIKVITNIGSTSKQVTH